MPVVSLDSLTIENFGPFYGRHEFKFSSLGERTGILIGGKNGAGKTHLLRALYLATVGETGRHDLTKLDKDSDATRFILDKALNRQAASEGWDEIKLEVAITQHDENGSGSRKVNFVREIRFRKNSATNWRSYAQESGGATQIDDEMQLDKLREALLPRHLARFFFFDAERSQSLNLGEEDIVDGVSRILGLWSYSHLENDLRGLINAKIPQTFHSATATRDAETKLADISGEIVRSDSLIKSRRKDKASLEIEIRENESELSSVVDELTSLGAVDPEDLNRSQDRRNEIDKAKVDLQIQLSTAWEKAMPLAILGKFKSEFTEALSREEKRRSWESSRATVEPKIPQIQEDVFKDVPIEYALEGDTHRFYAKRLETALQRLFHPPPEGMAERVFITDRTDINVQIRTTLNSDRTSIANLAECCATIERFDSESRELESRIKQMTQNRAAMERGDLLNQKRGQLSYQREQLQKQLNDLDFEIAQLDARLIELLGQEKVQQEIVDKAERGRSLAALAASYRQAAETIRERAAIQLREQISQNVGELWTEIVGRELEFSGMEFDAHWRCWLARRDGSKVSWEDANTSAGQRQVRMLAFYEALRRLAKSVPPLVVDTPLARLDKEVRSSVLDKLYLSGQQSLILSTDSEIDPDGPLFSRFCDRLARVYTLHPHGDPNSRNYQVRVSNDYFGKVL
ncbi:MAG TPA: AAA family ATPase [Abditibacteriaceae bacterium]|jgi:DNA sulfur modification protein DndD